MQCLRCGRETHGSQYCDSCAFYAMNDQCWRCRMYLPRIELQEWKGMIYCPYCIMEIRDEDIRNAKAEAEKNRKMDAPESPGEPGEPGVPPDTTPFGSGNKADYECDKCKGELDIAYIVADHKFCELCFNQQVRKWRDSGIRIPPYMKYRIKEGIGLFARLIRFLKWKINEAWERRIKKKKA